ncbi:alpha/beta hydrolase [Hymenobacter sp. RP-2-7]|uniref:Alpha/beta hydrolase n=1 Tax=Hymenobacter polaris TaxID=2682546 RepID=A0A7Y0FMZ9_9BACT|nr:alpha/beta fold hydrolase [Hymenobacter polaris]NML66418.1 alpha/beta hydrolase [Hymenobacter polaris]
MKLPLLLALAACLFRPGSAPAQVLPSLSGDWRGSLGPLTLTAHLRDPAGGPRSATLDVPEQHAQGLPLEFSTRNDSVFLYLAVAHARFAGKRAADGHTLVGDWEQAGRLIPLTFTQLVAGQASAAAPRRPQTPKGPFPYRSRPVTFASSAPGVMLAGTLTEPAGTGPFPAVVLLTGSGPEDRDETLFDHKPFAVLADYLTRRGVAVLRFDDRGVGQSTGTLAGTTSADYAADARAALGWLRAQPGIAQQHVGLLGHSEGGTAAVLAAGRPQGPSFLVLLAAPGIAGNELIVQQTVALARLQVSDPAALAATERQERELLAVVLQNPDNAQARAKLRPLLASAGLSADRTDQVIGQLTSPGYRALLADRPARDLAQVHCPVLALNGSKDLQVAAGPNLAGIRQGLQAAGNRDVTVRELPGLNHLFQTAATGSIAEYSTSEETFAPVTLQAIGDWVLAHGK